MILPLTLNVFTVKDILVTVVTSKYLSDPLT